MKLIPSASLTLAALALVAGCGAPDGTPAGSAAPDPARPNASTAVESAPSAVPPQLQFAARTVDGEEFSGQSLAGKPAVVWFWSPWCSICQKEAPGVLDAARANPTVTFLGVAAQDQVPAMREFVSKYQVGSFEHLADTDAEVWKRFGVIQQPAFAFIKPDGTVELHNGTLSAQELTARTNALASA